MNTPNYQVENIPDWKLWFRNELLKYQRWIVYILIFIITNISALLYMVLGRKNKFGWLLIIPLIVLIVNEIAYIVRKKDVEDLLNAQMDLTETKTLTVNSIKGREINKDYCYNYMKACGERIQVGHRYQITYLKKTMGKYIIDWLDLDKPVEKKEDGFERERIEKERKEKIEVDISKKIEADINEQLNEAFASVNLEVRTKEPIQEKESKENKESEAIDINEELEKRGLDIEEIKREIYNRNNSINQELNVDIEKIMNKSVKKVKEYEDRKE